ncbi:ZIP family metal transporter [Maribacter litopenaei]|uniref:ZIP family metal transporter n=1 Tax=Maribacter litopenaei TaxID=2976127 RepID=UPI00308465FF
MIYILPILGVLLSYIFVYWIRPTKKEHFRLLLAFSGAFLLALTIFELLPEVYEHSNTKTIGIFIMLGILLQIFLEFFSKGAEHGHVHLSNTDTHFPWLLFASLSLHSLLEGVPLSENNSLIYGILIHKIAIAVILSFFLLGIQIETNYFCIVYFSIFLDDPFGHFSLQYLGFF